MTAKTVERKESVCRPSYVNDVCWELMYFGENTMSSEKGII